jgi:Phage portal protein
LALLEQLKHAWNAFRFKDDNPQMAYSPELGPSYGYRPDRSRMRPVGGKTIVTAIYTRLAIDMAAVPMYHVREDEDGKFQEEIDSGLNNCLTVGANVDQAASMFRQDIAASLFDLGCIAILPVDTTLNPLMTGGYDILSMRIGQIVQWYPQHVKVRAYNENTGLQEDVIVPKAMVAIVENPLFAVMNEPSSTLQRLLRKLALLDAVDEQSASGKLDIIIQLPYVIKTEARRQEADKRVKDIEFQLKGSPYGIAYTDGTEKITQLNRPAENNLMSQIEYLTKMLYGQLGLTEEVMNGTASEETMINYYNRSIEPVLRAVAEAMARTFLTKTARTQGQTITYIRDPFQLVPVKDLAEIVDKFIRNRVASSNDMRAVIGWRPSSDPGANKLQNPNIPAPSATPSGNGSGQHALASVPKLGLPPGAADAQGVTSQNGS